MRMFVSNSLAQSCFWSPGVGYCTRLRPAVPRDSLAIALYAVAINWPDLRRAVDIWPLPALDRG